MRSSLSSSWGLLRGCSRPHLRFGRRRAPDLPGLSAIPCRCWSRLGRGLVRCVGLLHRSLPGAGLLWLTSSNLLRTIRSGSSSRCTRGSPTVQPGAVCSGPGLFALCLMLAHLGTLASTGDVTALIYQLGESPIVGNVFRWLGPVLAQPPSAPVVLRQLPPVSGRNDNSASQSSVQPCRPSLSRIESTLAPMGERPWTVLDGSRASTWPKCSIVFMLAYWSRISGWRRCNDGSLGPSFARFSAWCWQ